MENSKVSQYGFYVSVLGVIVTLLALIRDYFNFQQSPGDFWKSLADEPYLLYILTALLSFIVGFLFHKYFSRERTISKAKTIRHPKILIAYTDEEIYGNDVKIISDSRLSKSVTTLPQVTIPKLREVLVNNEFDIVHLGIPINNDGDVQISDEQLPSKGLMDLIELSKAELLVLGSCSSVELTSNTIDTVNMIAVTSNITTDEFEAWEKLFYSLLAEGLTLSKAFAVAKNSFAKIPITMISNRDLIFIRK